MLSGEPRWYALEMRAGEAPRNPYTGQEEAGIGTIRHQDSGEYQEHPGFLEDPRLYEPMGFQPLVCPFRLQ